MVAVYFSVSFVACTININGELMHSCAGDTETSSTPSSFLEQSTSKEESQDYAPSSSIIWQDSLSSSVEANEAGIRKSRLR